jgi:hypothetical protein
MSELSPEARELVDDGLSVLRPSSRDRARVATALAARLGTAALLLPEAAGAAPKALAVWPKLATVAASVSAGIAAIGATYWLTQTAATPTEAPVKPPAVAAPVVTHAPPPATSVESDDVPPSALAPEPVVTTPRKAATVDPLVEEVAILSKATSALRAGNPAEGLRLLEEHQRKFPKGRLAEERRAARIQALCALGKLSAAEAELARLAQSSPRSPHLARAQRACGIKP